ncbi:MAG TPA: helix-hairpin-helix domain-containing protein [Usitatibacter sp.]|nr:helix-hairpin-helix domain-containing protein [Usitatibacter sp.]
MRAIAALAIFAALPAAASVNVNTAQQSELQALHGLDKYQARTIIEYRNQNGPYRSVDDLAKALGEPAAEKVAGDVTFSGPPYVAPPHASKKKSRIVRKKT